MTVTGYSLVSALISTSNKLVANNQITRTLEDVSLNEFATLALISIKQTEYGFDDLGVT